MFKSTIELNSQLGFDERIAGTPSGMVLPPKIQLELNERGPAETTQEDVRITPRFKCKGPAVLEWVESPYGISGLFPTTQVIVRNLSRTGFSILADRQWFPEQLAILYLPVANVLTRVTRARRLGSRCFDIGLKILQFKNVP